MIKLTVFLARRPDLSHSEFIDYWRNRHAPLLLSLPGFTTIVRRYIQQHPAEGLPDGLPIASYDGAAEVWVDDEEAALKGLASDWFHTVVADDEEKFLDRAKTVIMISSEASIIS